MSDTARDRGLWGEIALTLGLITAAAVFLNGGVFWLMSTTADGQRRMEVTETLVRSIATQLEVESTQSENSRGHRRILRSYVEADTAIEQLVFVDSNLEPIARGNGAVPLEDDVGFREAFFGPRSRVELVGPPWGPRFVVATAPVAPEGHVIGAVRLKVPLFAPLLPGGLTGFALVYTLASGLAIAVFGLGLFRRRLIDPIQKIREGTRVIAGGDFSHRVEVDASRELRELCVSLNQLGSSLSEYRTKTEQHVDEVERASRELRRTQEALIRSERLASVGRLAAGLAHEVGNPLAAVLGYMELLVSGLDDEGLETDLIHRSQKELDRIHSVLRGLLDHAHPGTGKLEEIDPVDALNESMSRLRHQAVFQGVEVEVSTFSKTTILGAPEKLQQVLVNLMLNAIGAMDHSEERWIRWELEAHDGGTEFRCMDSGTGFSEEAIVRAFEPFFTTKEVGAGTGLGLYTCLQLIQSMGGHMAVENQVEGGAKVSFWLPSDGGRLASE